MQCRKEDNQIILRPMAEMAVIGVFATFFVIIGFFILVSLFRQEDGTFSADGFLTFDWFGVAFIVVWISVASWMAYTALYSKIRYCIVIDNRGIHEKGVPFGKGKDLCWSEVRDYGYYFVGNYNFNGRTGGMYRLYFSPSLLESKNAYRKKANSDMIQIDIDECELMDVAENTVFPFCRQYRSFEPNTVDIRHHFM